MHRSRAVATRLIDAGFEVRRRTPKPVRLSSMTIRCSPLLMKSINVSSKRSAAEQAPHVKLYSMLNL